MGKQVSSVYWLMLVVLTKCCRNDEWSYKAAPGMQAEKKENSIQEFIIFYAVTSYTNSIKVQWKWQLSNKILLELTVWQRSNKEYGCHTHY